MTALSAVPPRALRPVPWPRLGWVVWRRYRATLAATVGVLGLIGGYLVIDGLRMRNAYAAYLACAPANSARCQLAWTTFRDDYGVSGLLVTLLLLLPGMVGAFAGTPILARELETGTFRYLWTQGVGRMRWTIAALAAGTAGVAVIMAAFGALVTWYDQPLADAGIKPRLRSTVFPVTGLAGAGWAMAGFALGVLAGLLWRRVLPALATALAVWFGLAFLVGSGLRLRYLTPLTTTGELSNGDLLVAHWWTRAGVRVGDADLNAALPAIGGQPDNAATNTAAGGADTVQYLIQHGFTQVTGYQPDSRYWAFQWIEFGWLAGLTLALLSVTLWLLKRRTG